MEDLPVGLHIEVPGWVYQPNIGGVRAFKSDRVPNRYAHMMGVTKISEGSFDRVVDAVLADERSGLGLDDLGTAVPQNGNLVIRQILPQQVPDYADGLARACGMDLTSGAIRR